MRRAFGPMLVLLLALSLTPSAASGAASVTAGADDDQVTGMVFVRHDGGSDIAILECNNKATDPIAADPLDGDADPNDGGSARQGNEPYVVVDPTNPNFLVAGWNDYCLGDLNAGWEGLAFSLDGGQTWMNSLVPGYPQDTSTEGILSPLYGRQRFAGDPIAAFDAAGNLFVGGIAFNRAGAVNGDVFVATFSADDVGAFPMDYLRTRVVGAGTPSRNIGGIFQDKPMLEVDRTGTETDGNAYVCWSRFIGNGKNKIYFSRSTDMGETFSRPVALSGGPGMGYPQGCDIAVEADGDVYVTWRTYAGPSSNAPDGLAFARSADGGASFAPARFIRSIVPYAPNDGTRDCGDGPYACPSGYVFARIPLEPRVTADQTGELPGVYLIYNEVAPASIVQSGSTYSSAGAGMVGQSLVYVVSSTDDGATWSAPVAVDPAPAGHQFFADGDALDGRLAIVWQDSRTDDCYSVQRPMGNTEGATACADPNVVNTFVAASDDGSTFAPAVKVSDVGHQPQYEMFGNRDVPFQGDYNWISLVRDGTGLFGYLAWTDNRDVLAGTDPREAVQDGFDVQQCRANLGGGAWGPDTCPNAGGLDQGIYGNSISIP